MTDNQLSPFSLTLTDNVIFLVVLLEVEKGGSGATEQQENSPNSFAYFAPLWIVVTAFAIPAVVFMLWKASQKSKL